MSSTNTTYSVQLWSAYRLLREHERSTNVAWDAAESNSSFVRSRNQNLYLPTYVPLEARINCFITLLVEINFSQEAKLVLPMS